MLRTDNEYFIRFDNLSAGDYLKCFAFYCQIKIKQPFRSLQFLTNWIFVHSFEAGT